MMKSDISYFLFRILLGFIFLFIFLVDYLVPAEVGIGTLYAIPTILVTILIKEKKSTYSYLMAALILIVLGSIVSDFSSIGPVNLFIDRFISVITLLIVFYTAQRLVQSDFTKESYENLFKLGLENSPIGILYVSDHGKILYSNKWITNIFGYEKNEIIGEFVEILVPDEIKQEHPELRESFFRNPTIKKLAEGRNLYGKRKDGKKVLLDIGLSPLKTKKGLIAVVNITLTTEKEILLQEIQEKNTLLNFAIEETNDGWWDWKLKEDWEYMSPKFWETFGYDYREKEHKPSEWQDMIHPEDLKLVLKNLDLHIKTKGTHPYHQEVRYRHKNGKWMTVICKGKIIEWSEKGEPLRMVGSHTNITDRKNTELALENSNKNLLRSNKELEQFAYAASHDLQAPIRHISINLDILKSSFGQQLSEEQMASFEFVNIAAKKMKKIVNDLLKLSRVAESSIKKTNIDLNKLLNEVILVLKPDIENKKATIIFENLSHIFADHNLIYQVFQNILQNSLKYSKGHIFPEIIINTEMINNYVKIRIKDNGIGFNPIYNERIFEIFKRVSTDDKYKGTGIGLSLCKKIIELHGGEVWANSVENEGTVISFTLPII